MVQRVNAVQKILCEASAPPSNEAADAWIEREVELTGDAELKGRVSMRWVPMQRFVVRKYQQDSVRRITALVGTQCVKTTTALLCLTWKVRNRPSSAGWYTDTAGSAKLDYKTKILPFLESCNVLADEVPTRRDEKTHELIQFASMNLYIFGAESKRNRERITLTEVFGDEARNMEPGAIEELEGRFKTVRYFKFFLFSTAGKVSFNENREPVGDGFFLRFWRGTRHQFFWPCPHCGHRQTFRFGRKKSPLYPEKREKGGFVLEVDGKLVPLSHFEVRQDVYDMAGIEAATRYECENCQARFRDEDKFALIDAMSKFPDGGAMQTNPMASPDDISVHWWEAYMPWPQCAWGKIFVKFVLAEVAARHGNLEPLRVFVTDTTGEPWEEMEGARAEESEILKRCGNYSLGEIEVNEEFAIQRDGEGKVKWAPAQILTCDNQHGFVEILHRVYGRTGQSLLIETMPLASFDEVRAYQLAKQILDGGVSVDCAWRPKEVFDACLRYGHWIAGKDKDHVWNGWLPILGDDAEEFTRSTSDGSIRTFYKAIPIDTNIGRGSARFIQRLSFSKPHYQDLLFSYALRGKLHGWTIPKNIKDAKPEYLKQLSNTEKRAVIDAKGQVTGYEFHEKGRHDKSDCEMHQLAMCDFRSVKILSGAISQVKTVAVG